MAEHDESAITRTEMQQADQTAPYELPDPPSWLRRQPLVALLVAIVIADLSALVAELASGATDPVVVALLGTLATILAVGGRLAWLAVTPVADPRLSRELPLVVAPDLSDPDGSRDLTNWFRP